MATKREWLVILPDYPDALERRMAIRAKHLANAKADVKPGLVVLGGGMLAEPEEEGKPLSLNGSVLMIVAETKEKALERVHSDVYYEGNVWDKSKIQVIPFKTAIREQL